MSTMLSRRVNVPVALVLLLGLVMVYMWLSEYSTRHGPDQSEPTTERDEYNNRHDPAQSGPATDEKDVYIAVQDTAPSISLEAELLTFTEHNSDDEIQHSPGKDTQSSIETLEAAVSTTGLPSDTEHPSVDESIYNSSNDTQALSETQGRAIPTEYPEVGKHAKHRVKLDASTLKATNHTSDDPVSSIHSQHLDNVQSSQQNDPIRTTSIDSVSLLDDEANNTTAVYDLVPSEIETVQTDADIGDSEAVNIPDPSMCDINCPAGVLCEYPDEVDMRIIVMSYDRYESLGKCLTSVGHLHTLGDLVSVEVWIDRSTDGSINKQTLEVAREFQRTWTKGRVCIHEQTEHVGIGGQWRNTWRPRENTTEIGLILEDDIDISPQAYRWLKHVSKEYGHRTDISGYTLKMEDLQFLGHKHVRAMYGPASDTVYLYGIHGTWGFSPRPAAWRAFQDWFLSIDDSFKPYVEGIEPTMWFRRHERRGNPADMSEMWHIYHSNVTGLYCVFCNLVEYTGDKFVLLAANRMERGLHYRGGVVFDNTPYLMQTWNTSYVDFPENIVKYNYDGYSID